MAIQFKYYKATGEKSEEVKDIILSKTKQAREKQRELQQRYDSDGVSLKGIHVIGLLYKDPPTNSEHLIFKGDVDLDGITHGRYVPNKRYRKGKELAQAMQEARGFNYSDYACSAFKVHAIVLDGSGFGHPVMYHSVAGIRGGNLIFKIPYNNKETLPTIPVEFVEISKHEFEGDCE